MTDATLSNARNAVIKFTGTITGNQIVSTTGAFTVQFKTVSGTGFTFATTDKGTRFCYSDGTNIVDVNAAINTISQFTLPTTDGTNGQSIITDGSGNLSFDGPFTTAGKAIAFSLILG
jgi:hypothetical protein